MDDSARRDVTNHSFSGHPLFHFNKKSGVEGGDDKSIIIPTSRDGLRVQGVPEARVSPREWDNKQRIASNSKNILKGGSNEKTISNIRLYDHLSISIFHSGFWPGRT
jgi:hypothetical protein